MTTSTGAPHGPAAHASSTAAAPGAYPGLDAAEDLSVLDKATQRRVRARSRRLFADLMRPWLWRAGVALAALVLENAGQLAGPLLIARAIDSGVPRAADGRAGTLVWCVAGFAVCTAVSAAARYAFFRISGSVGQAVLYDLRMRIFRQAQRLPVAFHDAYTSGRVVSRLTADIDAVRDLVEGSLDGLLTSLLTVAGIAVLLLWLDVPMALVVLFSFFPLLLLSRWFREGSRRAYRRARNTVAEILTELGETLGGIRAVQTFRAEHRKAARMNTLNEDFLEAQTEALGFVARYTSGVRLVGNTALVLVLAIGSWRLSEGSLQLGILTAFVLYLRKFYDPLDELAHFTNLYVAASTALEKIAALLAVEPSVPEPTAPAALPADRPGRGRLAFHAVDFRYAPAGPPVLPRFDLTVPAGQTVAVVGATGAGKSTLAKLAARFYDPSGGHVTLDGVDLRDLPDETLRREVILVTQENFLFTGTIAENLLLARPDATREDLRAAAAAVHADRVIEALPDGYDTQVSKRGSRLSAGQRQMVALTRAFLADPTVLLLDEATSSLDIPTERAVRVALSKVLADRTAVIIAHRLSTVLSADRVLVMDGGRIVEDGPPRTLAAGAGPFSRLYATWVSATSGRASRTAPPG
ncbi:ABC transporter ATP-binding protein [Streptomyces sp. x-80]|uniref:ABC transporter ATP-binding protein n=1 Tax=Streptomyces sp. x-80 TaxID=2789282 RepID=UPI0039800E54